jgi:hypothetical protein
MLTAALCRPPAHMAYALARQVALTRGMSLSAFSRSIAC